MDKRVTDFEMGISTVDTEYMRPRMAASHLVVQNGRAAFVDTGTNNSVPFLLQALEGKGLGPEHVDYLFVTHVHLDHAGGTGALMRAFPNATALLHPRGVRHMTDPERLIAGSIAVYGEEAFHRIYGEILPVDPDRVRIVADDDVIDFAGRPMRCIHTEGHARHHYCVIDEQARAVFTGDSFGLSYRELDTGAGAFILPTTTPVQFDPGPAHEALDRILDHAPEAAFLTHYSRVTDLPRLARDLHRDLDAYVAMTGEHAGHADREARMLEAMQGYYRERLSGHGLAADEVLSSGLLDMDFDLNIKGLLVWADRQAAT